MKSSLSSLQDEIISNPKEINKINVICEAVINDIQSINKVKTDKEISVLTTILNHYLKSPKIKPSKELISFLDSKVDLLFKIIFDLSTIELDVDSAKIIFSVFKSMITFKDRIDTHLPLYTHLINSFILTNEYIYHDIILLFIKNFKKNYNFIFDAIIKEKEEKLVDGKGSVNMIYNLYNFLIGISELDDDIDLKQKYQEIIIFLINHKLFPTDLVKNFLIYLNKTIINNVANPLIFSDYLINKTANFEIKSIEDFDIRIFGLSSLFILLTKYKLDYDKYYALLYRLIGLNYNSITIFDNKHNYRLFKILELSLKSSSVPFNVICSFLKKLCRLAMFMKDEIIVMIITLITLVIQSHPSTLHMLMYKRSKKELKENTKENSEFNWDKFNSNLAKKIKNENKENEEIKKNVKNEEKIDLGKQKNTDLFDDNSVDPYKTNAQFCSLWELYTLQNHYNIKVRKAVNKLTSNFLPKQFALEEIKDKEMLFDIEKTNAHFYISD